jgi:hypothetical protein
MVIVRLAITCEKKRRRISDEDIQGFSFSPDICDDYMETGTPFVFIGHRGMSDVELVLLRAREREKRRQAGLPVSLRRVVHKKPRGNPWVEVDPWSLLKNSTRDVEVRKFVQLD